MALATLKPTTRVVHVLIGTTEYNTVLDTVGVRSDAPEIDEIVFANEATSGDHDIGTERLTITLGGILKKGAPESVPFLPLASYQGKAFVISFDFNATGALTVNVSGTLNMISAGPDVRAGGAGRTAATARNTGAFTVAWPTT